MKRKDIWVLLGVALLAVLLLVLGQNNQAQPVKKGIPTLSVTMAQAQGEELPLADSYLRIKQGDAYYHLVPLLEKGEIVIQQEGGKENIIHVDQDSVVMFSANCPNHDCVRQGVMTLKNRETRAFQRWITCLPHQLSLELLDRDEALRLNEVNP